MRSEMLRGVGSGCKDHPNNKQIPGVCSSCLRDKLSQLYLHSNHKPADHALPSFPSSYLSASPQPFSSADAYRPRHRRNASDVTDSISSMLSFNHGLSKSRSVAFASRNRLGGGGRRKNDGFWSKLLKLTRKGTKDILMHSTTIREVRG